MAIEVLNSMTKEEFIKGVEETLPSLIRNPNNSKKLKELISEISSVYHEIELENNRLSLLMDIDSVSGYHLDFLGKNIGISRNKGELDEYYKLRIVSIMKGRFSLSSIPELYSYLNVVTGVTSDKVEIIENVFGNPATFAVKINTEIDVNVRRATLALEFFKPAGVEMYKTIVISFTWEDMKTKGEGTWGYWKKEKYKW